MKMDQELKQLPDEPGVYILYDAHDQVIYVGKANSLSKRVPAHFRGQDKGYIISPIGQEAVELEYIVTANESEALVLEDNLIKRYQPRHNIRLKDDKSFPFVRITLAEEFPRVEKTRTIVNDGSRYIGPFSNVKALDGLLKSVNRIVPIATCKPVIIPGKRKRPCLKFDIGRCPAPCVGKISKEDYMELINEFNLMFTGQHDKLEAHLHVLMKKTADAKEYEKAARYRDRLRAVQRGRQAQRATHWNQLPGRRDVLGLARAGPDALVQLLVVREGRVVGQQPYPLNAPSALLDETVLEGFLKQYYIRATEIPEEIIVSNDILDSKFLERWLTKRRGEKTKVRIIHPRRGPRKSLVDMATENAQFHLYQLIERLAANEERRIRTNTELVKRLHLPEEPEHIEAFDISTLQGVESVGVCVVFNGGLPDKKHYRRFKIRKVQQQDDFAMMHEVVERRYKRQLADKKPLPNLIVIDGGRGHLSTAQKALQKIGSPEIPIIGIAKNKPPESDQIYVTWQSSPIKFPKDSYGLRLLQRVRDEAHRFAITYHRKLRQKKGLKLVLTDVPGVGIRRATLLLQHFGNIKKLAQASVDEVASVPHISRELAQQVLNYLSSLYK